MFEKYPTVTEVISSSLDTSYFTKEAAERGTAVHKLCSLKLSGVAEEPDLSGELVGYHASFLKWEHVMRPSGVLDGEQPTTERRLVDHNLMITGTPDFIGRTVLNKGVVLVDFKTSLAVYPWWKKQLAAYRYLYEATFPDVKIDVVYSLRIRKNGGSPLAVIYSEEELSEGLSDFKIELEKFIAFNRVEDTSVYNESIVLN